MSEETLTYKVTPQFKKSTYSIELWDNMICDKKVILEKTTIWRYGEFNISIYEKEKEELLKKDYIKINDYDLIHTRSREKEEYTALAKVILDNPKNNYVFDNRTFLTKRYVFPQPVDIRVLNIQLLNPHGDIVDLGEQDWSMTIEMEIIENSKLYENYRTHRLS